MNYRTPLTERYKGDIYCRTCGEQIRWRRLKSGQWIAVEREPVLYIPGEGKAWLIERKPGPAEFVKNCKIWRPGMSTQGTKKGYMPHAWQCWANR